MTDGLNIISTDFWRVLLPADWKQEEQAAKTQIYFRAKDETKGAYFLAWRIEEGTAQSVVEKRSRADFEGLRRMENGEWRILEQWKNDDLLRFTVRIDCLNEQARYRIVSQTMASGPWAIRATFHDYDCTDYLESKEWFDPLIRSFEFNHEKA
jgi:hypothetical protein